MCGRFALVADEQYISNQFALRQSFKMVPRYNVAPSEAIPVIHGSEPQLDFMRWGFTPKWIKPFDPKPPMHINARSESAHEKPTFKAALKSRRCLIPASGYFEWKKLSSDKKQPYFIYRPDSPLLGIAAIWETYMDSEHQLINTCAILTAPAGKDLTAVHERQPLVCPADSYRGWLDGKTSLDIMDKLLSYSAQGFKYYPVSLKINSPKFDEPSCLQSLQ